MKYPFMAVLLSFLLCTGVGHAAAAADAVAQDHMPSLITATPLEGRVLAITIVRKTIGAIQKDADIKQAVRTKYEDDPQLLMYAAELVALEFRTIAEANNYWRPAQQVADTN